MEKAVPGNVDKLYEITSRLEHLETAAEWIARETVHSDPTISQTGTLITTLADDLRERVFGLVKELEMMLRESVH